MLTPAGFNLHPVIVIAVAVLACSALGCGNDPAPPGTSKTQDEHSSFEPRALVSKRASGSDPPLSIFGPTHVVLGETQTYQILIFADDANMAKLGKGKVVVEFTGGKVHSDGTQVWVFPQVLLEPLKRRVSGVLLDTTIDVTTLIVPASAAVKRAIGLASIARTQLPRLEREFESAHSVKTTVGRVELDWNDRIVDGTSCLRLDARVTFEGDAPPGVSVNANLTVLRGTGSQRRREDVSFSLPWLSLEDSQRRDLQLRASRLKIELPDGDALRTLQAVDAVLAGDLNERDELLRSVVDAPRLPPRVRSLCAGVLSLVPDDEGNLRLETVARSNTEPQTRAACVFALADQGRDWACVAKWTSALRKDNELEVLKEFFVILDEDSQKLNVARAVASLPHETVFDWLVQQLTDEELSQELRMRLLDEMSDCTALRASENGVASLASACEQIIVYQQRPSTQPLCTKCFRVMADLSPEFARGLIVELNKLASPGDRSRALRLMLLDGPRRELHSTMQESVEPLLDMRPNEQREIVGWLSETANHDLRRRLLPFLFKPLKSGARGSEEIHAILTSSGLADDASTLLLSVARKPDVQVPVRREVLNYLLRLVESSSDSSDGASRAMLKQLVNEYGRSSRAELVGIEYKELNPSGLAKLLLMISMTDEYDVQCRGRALSAIGDLGIDHRRRSSEAIRDQIIKALPEQRVTLTNVLLAAQRNDLVAASAEDLALFVTDAATARVERSSMYNSLTKLTSAGKARMTLLNGLRNDRTRDAVLENVAFAEEQEDETLHHRATEILCGWIANLQSPDQLVTTAYAGLAQLDKEQQALQTLDKRLKSVGTVRVFHLGKAFSQTENENRRVVASLSNHLVRGRGYVRCAVVFGFVALTGLVLLARHGTKRTRSYEECRATRGLISTSILVTGVALVANTYWVFYSPGLTAEWLLTELLFVESVIWALIAVAIAGLIVLIVQIPKLLPWKGSLRRLQRKHVTLTQADLKIHGSPRATFFAQGDTETYDEVVRNPELDQYPARIEAWENACLRHRTVEIPAWESEVDGWSRLVKQWKRDVKRLKRDHAEERAKKSCGRKAAETAGAGGAGGLGGAMVGGLFFGPPGAIIGGAIGALAGGIGANAGPSLPSKPAKPQKPEEPVKPSRPPNTITRTQTRPTNRVRVTFLSNDGTALELWLSGAKICLVSPPEVRFKSLNHVGCELFDDQNSTAQTTCDSPVSSVVAEGGRLFGLRIESSGGVLVAKEDGSDVQIDQRHAKDRLEIGDLKKLEITGDVSWQQGNELDLDRSFVVGTRISHQYTPGESTGRTEPRLTTPLPAFLSASEPEVRSLSHS